MGKVEAQEQYDYDVAEAQSARRQGEISAEQMHEKIAEAYEQAKK